jgi:hypothetical protein
MIETGSMVLVETGLEQDGAGGVGNYCTKSCPVPIAADLLQQIN